MGTNYYLRGPKPEPCPCCGHANAQEELHIGKSSGGWCFSLHVIPEEGIVTLEDWKNRFQRVGWTIWNEYGEQIDPMKMLQIIMQRGRDEADAWGNSTRWSLYGGSEERFHIRNHSQRGPNGLLRHQLGWGCVGHGEGTWDYIVGEFS